MFWKEFVKLDPFVYNIKMHCCTCQIKMCDKDFICLKIKNGILDTFITYVFQSVSFFTKDMKYCTGFERSCQRHQYCRMHVASRDSLSFHDSINKFVPFVFYDENDWKGVRILYFRCDKNFLRTIFESNGKRNFMFSLPGYFNGPPTISIFIKLI